MHIFIAGKTLGFYAVDYPNPISTFCGLYLFYHGMIDSFNALHYILHGLAIAAAM